jgi:hypothetical protein
VCGSVELAAAPFGSAGRGSFDICSCKFEFGFDDDPGASADAVETVKGNWERWRAKWLSTLGKDAAVRARAAAQLRAIEVNIDA